MSCLYATDYGPPDPGFNALADNGRLIKGFESHHAELARAQNLSQLQAMERVFARGESVTWCDNGYGWVYDPKFVDFFGVIFAFVVLPWMLMRVAPALARGLGVELPWGKKKTPP